MKLIKSFFDLVNKIFDKIEKMRDDYEDNQIKILQKQEKKLNIRAKKKETINSLKTMIDEHNKKIYPKKEESSNKIPRLLR